jgi:hypothetical protein
MKLSLLPLSLLLAVPALAQDAPAAKPPVEIRQFQVKAAAGEIEIDGNLDDAGWQGASVIDMPFEWFPGDNIKPSVESDALITFDETNLYLGFRCQDPNPKAIRAHLMDRDAILTFIQDDHVGVMLDTFNDERRAFQFRANPLGVQVDATYSEVDAAEDFSWDAIWDVKGRITDTGYVVEMKIPFKQLRFPRTSEPQTWGIEVFRSYPRNVRYRISSKHTDRAKDCTLCQENKITGFEGIAPGRNLEITPTLTAIRTDELDAFPNGDLVDGDEELEPGVTARWSPTPNTTVVATVNPDFSQVEADANQLAENTRFALFFDEKRPFFLEGADLYLTPLRAVFTRTVADPDWGFKFATKEGKNAFGLFVAEDDINNLVLPSNQGSDQTTIDDTVTSGTMRYRRDLGKASWLGAIYTGREGDDYHNRVGGLDGFFRFTPSDTVRVQYLRSQTQYPTAVANGFGQSREEFEGDAFSVQYDHFDKNWKAFVSYLDLDPEFRADSGFIPRVDVRTVQGQYQYFLFGDKDDWYAQWSFGVRGLSTDDHNSTLTDQSAEVFATLNGPYQSIVEVNVAERKTRFGGVTYDLSQQQVGFSINPSGKLRLRATALLGDEIDFQNGRKAEITQFVPGIQMRIGQHITAQIDHGYQRLDVPGGKLFDVNQSQVRFFYQFNVETFVRVILQRTLVERDPSLYTFPIRSEREDLFGQFLFSYKLNPQTVLFAGYTDNRRGNDEVSPVQTDRTFFLKVGYALLF